MEIIIKCDCGESESIEDYKEIKLKEFEVVIKKEILVTCSFCNKTILIKESKMW